MPAKASEKGEVMDVVAIKIIELPEDVNGWTFGDEEHLDDDIPENLSSEIVGEGRRTFVINHVRHSLGMQDLIVLQVIPVIETVVQENACGGKECREHEKEKNVESVGNENNQGIHLVNAENSRALRDEINYDSQEYLTEIRAMTAS